MTATDGGVPELRLQLRTARAQMDPEDVRWCSNLASGAVIESAALARSDTISGYLAFGNEADPIAAMHWAWHNDKRVYVPVLDGGKMCFAPWSPDGELKPNRYGIHEPVHHHSERLPPRELDLVLTPLVGFDGEGNRIGLGGGYYDRAFAFLKGERRPTRPYLVGFAYHNQQQPSLPAQRWDVPLDAVVTEDGWQDLGATTS